MLTLLSNFTQDIQQFEWIIHNLHPIWTTYTASVIHTNKFWLTKRQQQHNNALHSHTVPIMVYYSAILVQDASRANFLNASTNPGLGSARGCRSCTRTIAASTPRPSCSTKKAAHRIALLLLPAWQWTSTPLPSSKKCEINLLTPPNHGPISKSLVSWEFK